MPPIFFPDSEIYTEERAEESIAAFDESNDGFFALAHGFKEAQKLRNLSKLYTVLDMDHTYYIGSKSGLITAYGDADPTDSRSAIVKLREFQLPETATGPIMGLSMTYDGWLIAATEHGYIAAISRDFSDHRLIRLKHAEGAEDKATKPTGYGWIRNAYAIDDEGGIYIASQEHMHKVVWTGNILALTKPTVPGLHPTSMNGDTAQVPHHLLWALEMRTSSLLSRMVKNK